jgi:hypothetical protein
MFLPGMRRLPSLSENAIPSGQNSCCRFWFMEVGGVGKKMQTAVPSKTSFPHHFVSS